MVMEEIIKYKNRRLGGIDLEEDIKILEEFKKNGYSMLIMKYGDRYKAYVRLERAIENLLTRYKQLEEENEQLEAIKNEAIRRYNFESIPVSKVKEKIEELKGTEELLSDEQGYWGGSDLLAKIEVLQELLREE